MNNKLFYDKEKNIYLGINIKQGLQYGYEYGIYSELIGKQIPKKVLDIKLGGFGICTWIKDDYYFRSNTSGKLMGRVFKRTADLPTFKIKSKDLILLKLSNEKTTLNSGLQALETIFNREIDFRVCKDFSVSNALKIRMKLKIDDFKIGEYKYMNASCSTEIEDYIFENSDITSINSITASIKISENDFEYYIKNRRKLSNKEALEWLKTLSHKNILWNCLFENY